MPAQERTVQTEAVVLRHTDWGEADRLLWLFTRRMGKVHALAKGVRKIRSRKAGHLEPFTRVNLLLARGRDFWIVTQAETIDAYLKLRENLVIVGYAAYVVELIERFTMDDDENQNLYRLLIETLARLNQEADPAIPIRFYEIRLLDQLGYRPELFHCITCSAEIKPENQYFSIAQGGVLCPRCGPNIPDATPIDVETLRYLRHFQRSSFTQVASLQLSPAMSRQLEQFMGHYFTYHLERGLNTPAFLRRVKNHE